MSPIELRQRCHTILPGHRAGNAPAADIYAAMARWCTEHDVRHDAYGEGVLIQAFERKVADLLGYPAAVFVPTGTMAQTIALRLACEDTGKPIAAMHPTAHIVLHERSNYQLLDHFKTVAIGQPGRPWEAQHLAAQPDRIGAALYELPMREIGGQLPAWEKLDELKAACRARGIHFHLDGARLWEAAAGYGRSHAEICTGFDSAYVSLYKGLGGLGGAMLAGQADFIARARVWMQRLGGNIVQRSPYIVAAAMQFDERLKQMPACFARAREVAKLLGEFAELRINPREPQTAMFHIHLPYAEPIATAARNRLAQEHGVWLGGVQPGPLLESSYMELYVGDNLLDIDDGTVRKAMAQFLAYCREAVSPAA